MSRFRHVELQYASRLLNHGPTILITSYDAPSDRRNVMAAAWSMPVEFAPPRVAIVVDKSTWTREIIERNGTFGIVFSDPEDNSQEHGHEFAELVIVE
ncbi:flavin reductase, partial [Klebsiella pneumoniae]|uniref:flavin reductase family protein n=1 Tax=Klebsiella pneumoniae TaxID=573 RepID=UPI001615CC2A